MVNGIHEIFHDKAFSDNKSKFITSDSYNLWLWTYESFCYQAYKFKK